jgi:site-specific DNA recombinase
MNFHRNGERPTPNRQLDRWLLRAFSPAVLPNTIQALVDAQDDRQDEEQLAHAAEAKRVIADCDQKLTRYRAARRPAPTRP